MGSVGANGLVKALLEDDADGSSTRDRKFSRLSPMTLGDAHDSGQSFRPLALPSFDEEGMTSFPFGCENRP